MWDILNLLMESLSFPSFIVSTIVITPPMLAVYLSYKLSKKVLIRIYHRRSRLFLAGCFSFCTYILVSAVLILLFLGVSTGVLQVANDVTLWIRSVALGVVFTSTMWIFGLFSLVRNVYLLHKGRPFME